MTVSIEFILGLAIGVIVTLLIARVVSDLRVREED